MLTEVFDWITAERLSAGGVVAQAVAVVAAAAVAIRQLREARTLRIEQARPYVVVDLRGLKDTRAFSIAVSNHGRTTARDVAISFDPPLSSAIEDSQVRGEGLGRLADLDIWKNIPTLPPGRDIDVLFDNGPDRFGRREDGYPDRIRATVSYQGIGSGKGRYEDEYYLDFTIYWGVTYTQRSTLKDVSKSVDNLTKSVNALSAADGVQGYVTPESAADRSSRRNTRVGYATLEANPSSKPSTLSSLTSALKRLLS